jgi:ankyrin repeat protein
VVEQVGAKKHKDFMAAEEEAVFPFFGAVLDGDVAEAGRLLDEDGRLVEARAGQGYTALNVAVAQGRVGMVRLLLGRGADIEARNDKGFTPLHLVLLSIHEEVVEEMVDVLLDCGADASKTGPIGATPLIMAAGQGKTAAVKQLLRSLGGQGLDAQVDSGATAFWAACNMGHVDIARLLLLDGADHTIAHHDGTTPLMAAEDKGHEECVALIQVRTKHDCICVAVPETTRVYGLHTNRIRIDDYDDAVY